MTPEYIPEDVVVQSKTVFIKNLTISVKISSDQTRRFPVISIRGKKYIMVVVDYDSDTILEQTLTPRTETDLLGAITKLFKHLVDRGLQPHLYMLDIE